MILLEYFRENEITLSKKGTSAMARAVKEIYPTLSLYFEDDELVGRVLPIELPDTDCLKILQLTARYAGLWAFA